MTRLEGVLATLPNWLSPIIALTRPAAVTMVVSIPALGGCTVGVVAYFNVAKANAMADVATKFLGGIPDSAYGMIVALGLGYAAAKTTEVVKAGQQQSQQDRQPDPPPAPDLPGAGTAVIE